MSLIVKFAKSDPNEFFFQVLNSLAYAEMKKMNAAKLELKRIEELKAEVRADIHSVWFIWDSLYGKMP